VVPARGKVCVKTGLQIAIPSGTYARIAPRSGLAAKHFIDTGAGVVDEDYRGEVMVLLFNHGESDFPSERRMQAACDPARPRRLAVTPDGQTPDGRLGPLRVVPAARGGQTSQPAPPGSPGPPRLLLCAPPATGKPLAHTPTPCHRPAPPSSAVKKGDRIAQMILERIATPEVVEVDNLDDTSRGAGGFGSTGGFQKAA
jgi:dUTPase